MVGPIGGNPQQEFLPVDQRPGGTLPVPKLRTNQWLLALNTATTQFTEAQRLGQEGDYNAYLRLGKERRDVLLTAAAAIREARGYFGQGQRNVGDGISGTKWSSWEADLRVEEQAKLNAINSFKTKVTDYIARATTAYQAGGVVDIAGPDTELRELNQLWLSSEFLQQQFPNFETGQKNAAGSPDYSFFAPGLATEERHYNVAVWMVNNVRGEIQGKINAIAGIVGELDARKAEFDANTAVIAGASDLITAMNTLASQVRVYDNRRDRRVDEIPNEDEVVRVKPQEETRGVIGPDGADEAGGESAEADRPDAGGTVGLGLISFGNDLNANLSRLMSAGVFQGEFQLIRQSEANPDLVPDTSQGVVVPDPTTDPQSTEAARQKQDGPTQLGALADLTTSVLEALANAGLIQAGEETTLNIEGIIEGLLGFGTEGLGEAELNAFQVLGIDPNALRDPVVAPSPSPDSPADPLPIGSLELTDEEGVALLRESINKDIAAANGVRSAVNQEEINSFLARSEAIEDDEAFEDFLTAALKTRAQRRLEGVSIDVSPSASLEEVAQISADFDRAVVDDVALILADTARNIALTTQDPDFGNLAAALEPGSPDASNLGSDLFAQQLLDLVQDTLEGKDTIIRDVVKQRIAQEAGLANLTLGERDDLISRLVTVEASVITRIAERIVADRLADQEAARLQLEDEIRRGDFAPEEADLGLGEIGETVQRFEDVLRKRLGLDIDTLESRAIDLGVEVEKVAAELQVTELVESYKAFSEEHVEVYAFLEAFIDPGNSIVNSWAMTNSDPRYRGPPFGDSPEILS